MATEAEIREAERARLEALVVEHGTESERTTLLFSGIMRASLTLKQLAAATESDESLGYCPPESKLLARVARRAERRARLRLPGAACAGTPSDNACDCLERSLDQPGEDGKRAILKLAATFHCRKTVEPLPPPELGSQANAELKQLAAPGPPPKPTPQTPEPPLPRRRVRRWYDEQPSFRDMKF
jgi:hypothetical protein